MRGVVVVLAFCVGCVHADLVACEGGIACPVGDVCDPVHGGCVSPDQLSACGDLVDGDDCEAGPITGGCFGGVCLPRGCGNGVVETGEMCDDRNQTSGDGCRRDCLSDETCGNGVTDSGETCDDGNLMSRDDCDSHCIVETVRWTMIPISPLQANRFGAYDESTQRFVIRLPAATWEWDGTGWHVFQSPRVTGNGAAYFDVERGHLMWIDYRQNPSRLVTSEWSGGLWTVISETLAVDDVLAAAYDAPRKRAIVITRSGSITRAWSVQDLDWSLFPLPATTPVPSASIVFNPADESLVVFLNNVEYEWTPGQGWSSPVTLSTTYSMAWNPVTQRIGGLAGTLLLERTDSGWAPVTGVPNVPFTSVNTALWFDTAANRFAVMDNEAARPLLLDPIDGWIGEDLRATRPFNAVSIAADPDGGRFVVTVERLDPDMRETMWTWDGAWHPLLQPDELAGRFGTVSTYDPDRNAVMFFGGGSVDGSSDPIYHSDVWLLAGDAWTRLPDGPFEGSARVLAHDPVAHRLRLFDFSGKSYTLASTESSWVTAGDVPFNLTSYVWDAKNHRMVGTTIGGTFQEEDASTGVWTIAPLGPLIPHQAIGNARSGVVDLLPATDALDARLMRRDGLTWAQREVLPFPFGSDVAYNPRDGSTMFVSSGGGRGSFAALRELVSPTPLETCEIGVDTDTDGLAGCDDPDCFWACDGCPPYTTCATSSQ